MVTIHRTLVENPRKSHLLIGVQTVRKRKATEKSLQCLHYRFIVYLQSNTYCKSLSCQEKFPINKLSYAAFLQHPVLKIFNIIPVDKGQLFRRPPSVLQSKYNIRMHSLGSGQEVDCPIFYLQDFCHVQHNAFNYRPLLLKSEELNYFKNSMVKEFKMVKIPRKTVRERRHVESINIAFVFTFILNVILLYSLSPQSTEENISGIGYGEKPKIESNKDILNISSARKGQDSWCNESLFR